jgi:hypothetical protein
MRLLDVLTSTSRDNNHDHDLQRRIRAEFAEMPGLKLTVWQASRLFNLEAGRCERVLSELVAIGALCTSGTAFLRADGGRRLA